MWDILTIYLSPSKLINIENNWNTNRRTTSTSLILESLPSSITVATVPTTSEMALPRTKRILHILIYSNEANLDLSQIDEPPQGTSRVSTFDPVADRNLHSLASGPDSTSRDVKAGEELFQNYLYFISSAKFWKEEVLDLQAQCRGESLGQIKNDENRALEEEEEDSSDDDDDDSSDD